MATQENLMDNSFTGDHSNNKIEDLESQEPQQKVENQRLHDDYPKGTFRFFKISYWRKYFDFPQSVIIERLQSSIVHYPVFTEMIHEQPDLYGPFWIYTTIILFIGIAGNIHGYIDKMTSDDDDASYSFNYGFIPHASGLVYGIGFLQPTLLFLFMKLFQSPIKFYSTLCLYGYSLSCFVLITPICIIPKSFVQWCLLGYGGVSSSVFMLKNITRSLEGLSQQQKYGIYALVCGFQFVLVIFYKFYFFKIVY